MRLQNDDGTSRDGIRHEPIAPWEESAGVGLLPRFCTQPLPALRRLPASGGGVSVVVEPSGLGAKSSMTCLVGHIIHNGQSRYCDEHNAHQSAVVAVRTPCETLIHDVLAPQGLFAPPPPTVFTVSDHRLDDLSPVQRDHDRLPMREEALPMGRGFQALPTPDVPQYRELAKYVFDRVGWNIEAFNLHRCRIEHPVMPSSVVVQFELPTKA